MPTAPQTWPRAVGCLLVAFLPWGAWASDAFVATLDAEERAWLEGRDRIVIAFDDANPPMNYRDDDGAPTGVSIAYLRAIEARIGVPIELVGTTWDEALSAAMAHETDGIANAFDKPERRERLDFTQPYFVSPMALVIRSELARPHRIEDFDGRTLAVVEGSARVAFLRQVCPDSELILTENVSEAFAAVAAGRADGLLDDLVVADYVLETQFHANLQIGLLYYREGLNTCRFGLDNTHPQLVSVFDRALDDISEAEHRAIRDPWLRVVESVHVQRELSLSDEEWQWLLDHPVIRVGVHPDWYPFEYLDRGRAKGLAIDYLREVEVMLGVDFQVVRGHTWEELVDLARRREIDMFSCAAETSERREFLTFCRPFNSQAMVLFGKRGPEWISDLSVLEGRRLAVVAGYAGENWIRWDHPEIEVVPATDLSEAVALVMDGEAIAFMANSSVGSRQLTDLGLGDLVVIGETPYRLDTGFAVRSDWPELRTILDKAVDHVPDSLRNEIHHRWLPTGTETTHDFTWVVWLLAAATGVVVCTLVWNWRLAVAVQQRTRDLTASNTRLAEQVEARWAAEEHLAQARKMDAIGHLAGGIAHDFNNMLGGILAAAESLAGRVPDDAKAGRLIEMIRGGSQRASELTGNLLSFARQEAGERKALSVHACVEVVADMLRHSVGESIRLAVEIGAAKDVVVGDVSLIQSALLNLGLNARDAMPDGGTLRIATRDRELGEVEARAHGEHMAAGRYLEIVVEDTGTGIPEEIREHIFEPFFTSKPVGHGTGLGLAMVYSTARSHGGAVWAEAADPGTRFTLLLPTADAAVPAVAEGPGDGRALSGEVLVVDDEELVRSAIAELLQDMGYRVVTAADGDEALAHFQRHRDQIDLVCLDRRMPGMDGAACAAALFALDPGVRIVLMSGYSEDRALPAECDPRRVRFLAKPFSMESLAAVLDELAAMEGPS